MVEQYSLADTAERLLAEFGGRFPLQTVVTTVRRAKRDIDITNGPAVPELVERLARQRLTAWSKTRSRPPRHRD